MGKRRMDEVNQAVLATYLSGGNTRQLKGALRPLLRDAPLSRSAVSRVVGTIKAEAETWRAQPLDELNAPCRYLDAIALRVRCAGKVTSLPVLAAVGGSCCA